MNNRQIITLSLVLVYWPVEENLTVIKVHHSSLTPEYSTEQFDVIYSVSQKKVAPLKLFAIFSLRLSIFP